MFEQSNTELYYLDTSQQGRGEWESSRLLVNTVAFKKSKYSNKDYSRAVLARELQIKIG